MKRTLILPLVLTALAACTQESLYHGTGDEIVFGASTGYENGPETRTAYSGDLVGTSPKYERIDWVPGTDRIRVWCDQATHRYKDQHWADYKITSASNTSGQQNSRAEIAPIEENGYANGLVWGSPSATHYFYAVYPAASMGSTASAASLSGANGNKATVSGTIPAEQPVTWNASKREYKPDMNYAYMYAVAKVNPQTSGNVYLPFRPLMNAYEFTLKALSGNAPTTNLVSVTLSSSSSDMSGAFTATLSENGLDGVSVSDVGGSVSVSLGSGVLLNDNPVKVTLFALPVAQTDLTLELNFAGGARRSLALSTTDSGAISVDPGQKLYVSNLATPAAFFYDMVTIPDIEISGVAVLDETSKTVTVNTEKDSENGYGGANREARKTGWKAYYVDGSKSKPVKGTVVTGNADYSATSPDWIGVTEGDSGAGLDDAFKFKVHASPVEGAHVKTDVSPCVAAMINKLQHTDLQTLDLSMYNFLEGENYPTAETANCYIVNGYGTFLIPLVYGNAYKGGNNTGAYAWSTAADSEQYLRTFVNADGNAIASPFILKDGNLSKPSPYNGCVVWQDTQKTFEIVKDSDISILTSKPSAGAINCEYLQFEIKRENIKPGNVMIALRDANNKILWSWHIWVRADISSSDASGSIPASGDNANKLHVTEVTYLPTSSTTATIGFLSEPLGWTPPLSYEGGDAHARSYWIAIVSTETQSVIGSFKVSQGDHHQDEYDSQSESIYSAPYYQWGRKDPFLPTNGKSVNKIWTSAHYQIAGTSKTEDKLKSEQFSGTSPQKIGKTIQRPYLFNLNYNAYPAYRNLWDGDYNDTGMVSSEVRKTVYDPSPRGFTVMRYRAVTGAVSDGSNTSINTSATIYSTYYQPRSNANYNSEWPAGRRMTYNHTNNSDTYTVFIPALGWRGWDNSQVIYKYNNATWGIGYQIYYWTASSTDDMYGSTHLGSSFHSAENLFDPYTRDRRTDGFPIIPTVEE